MRIKSSHWVGAGLQIPWLLSRDTGEPAPTKFTFIDWISGEIDIILVGAGSPLSPIQREIH